MHEGGGQPRVPRGHLPTNPARPRPGPNHPAEQVPNHFIQHCGCKIKSLIFTSTLKSLKDVFSVSRVPLVVASSGWPISTRFEFWLVYII